MCAHATALRCTMFTYIHVCVHAYMCDTLCVCMHGGRPRLVVLSWYKCARSQSLRAVPIRVRALPGLMPMPVLMPVLVPVAMVPAVAVAAAVVVV